jgi:hypothetical protein
MDIPQARRPSLSGYINETMLLPWRWVSTRMEHARNYWISTYSREFPSSRPVWGVWNQPRLLFSSGSQIARNIARDSRVQVNLESGDELVIIEGTAHPLQEDDLEFWIREYNAKYNWDMPHTTDDVFEVRPTRVLAWVCDSSGQDGGALFTNSATEWSFGEST